MKLPNSHWQINIYQSNTIYYYLIFANTFLVYMIPSTCYWWSACDMIHYTVAKAITGQIWPQSSGLKSHIHPYTNIMSVSMVFRYYHRRYITVHRDMWQPRYFVPLCDLQIRCDILHSFECWYNAFASHAGRQSISLFTVKYMNTWQRTFDLTFSKYPIYQTIL